jgi:3-methylcrotonyl-CoA carboxylase alpha subunit
VRVERSGANASANASIDGEALSLALTLTEAAGPVREIVVGGTRFRVAAARSGNRIWVWCEGRTFEFETAREGRRTAGGDHHGAGLAAPMPGRVRRILAAEGVALARGDVVLVLEAMKMEHAIRAPRDGVLKRIRVAEGDLVEAGAELAELE